MGKKMNSVLPRLASCIQGVRSVAPYCIVGMLCGLTLCGEAAALRFHSNNSAVSSGVWMTTLDKVPRYLFTSDGDIPVDNIRSFDTNPYVITSFERGKDIPSVCVRIETSDMGNLTNLKVSYALETAHGTYAYEMQKKVNYHVCCGYLDLLSAAGLPAGRYTLRLTATANGYTSVSTSTSFNVAESSQTLIQALNCIDAVSEGLISLTTSSTSPWLKAGNGVMSASVGKNGISMLTMKAQKPIHYECVAAKEYGFMLQYQYGSPDTYILYHDYGTANQQLMANISAVIPLSTVTNMGILAAGHSASWVFTRDSSDLSFFENREGIVFNPLVVKPLITVNFNSNGGGGVSAITCVPGKPYGYLHEKWPNDFPAFPENGPSQPSNGGTFAGWYNSSGTRVTGASIVPEKATDHTLTARWGSGGGGSGSCDLGFYTPSTLIDPLLVTTVQGGTSSMTSIEQGTPIYLNYAFKNLVGSDDVAGFVNRFTLSNGITFDHSWNNSTLHAGNYGWAGESYCPSALQDLAPGTYTLTCRLDATDKLAEINEANNTKSITFKITPRSFTLTLNPNGGTLNGNNFGSANGTTRTASVTVTYGKSSYANLGRAERSGYTFTGWWTAASGGTRVFDSNGNWIIGSYWNSSKQWIYKGDVTLYAQWRENIPTYSLGLNPNGGTLNGTNFGAKNGTTQTATVRVTYGKTSYNAGMRATRSGYTFMGWWTALSGGSMQYDANGKYVPNSICWTADGAWRHKSNAMLYARWTTVTFNPTGGTLNSGNFGAKNGTTQTANVALKHGTSAYNAGMRATRSGYMFIGWWTAPSGGSQIYDASGRYKPNSRCWTADGVWKHEGNAALYARWLPLTLGGAAEWSMKSDGSWKSGAIASGQVSWLQTTVKGAGTMTFHWKVASAYDGSQHIISGGGKVKFEWMLDGVQQTSIDITAYKWSVVSLWIEGVGTHTIQWRYSKDSLCGDGNSYGQLRNVYWSGSVQ